jgi:glucose/arabinose dehydrogenase
MRLLSFFAVLALAACGVVQETETSPSNPDGASNGVNVAAPSLELVAELVEPVDAAIRRGDEGLYVASRSGTITRIFGNEEQTAFDITDLTKAEGERGLLGLAFSPDGSAAFLNFTNNSGNTVIARVDVTTGGVFDRSSLQELLTIEQPYANHNGGDIVVDASGALLVATGDGGSADDPRRLALDDSSLLGKILRIDPMTGEATLIARGLRNPWRIDLFGDDLWIADVGHGTWEEVSVLRDVSSIEEPVDFGWSAFEGFERFNEDQSSANHQPPLMVYEHGEDGCSISGGAVAEAGSLTGRYVFADFCSGKVWSIPTDVADPQKELLFEGLDQPVAIVRAGAELLVLSLQGSIWSLVS